MNSTLTPSLEQEAADILRRSPYLGRRIVRLERHEGRLTLHGAVQSYFEKQMAQEALRKLAGVGEIDNQLVVERSR